MRLGSALAFTLCSVLACGLEPGGTLGVSDAGEDRGTGVTDSGMTCNCVPTPPANFTFVAFQRDGNGACPPSYSTEKLAKEQVVTTPQSCTCDCAADQPAQCSIAQVSVDLSLQSNCSNATTMSGALTNGCFDSPNFDPQSNLYVKASATLNVSGGTCTKTEASNGPMLDIHTGHACKLTGSSGSCSSGDACVPDATGFSVCVMADGDQMCPSSYPQKHIVTSTGYHNDLGCKPCSCAPAPDCEVSGVLHPDPNCNMSGFPLKFDNACIPTNGTPKVHAIAAGVTKTTQACSKPMGYGDGVSGSFFPEMPYTICCR